MRCSTLEDWLAWQATLHPTEIDLGLVRCQQVAQRLHIVPFPCPVITVGGTNGKGSSVVMLDTILQAAGYRTARYLSPHLIHFNERLSLHNTPVTDTALCEAFAYVDQQRGEVSLTQFEFITLAALWLIAQAKPDLAILEVGLGGRLDAVNIIDPNVALITNVALDHIEWLGDNREQIGREKAGILRANRPAVYGEAEPPATVLAHAETLACPLYCWERDYHTVLHTNQTWSWSSGSVQYEQLPLPALAGGYQVQNAAGVLMALHCLPPMFRITEEAIRHGLLYSQLAGRLQVMPSPWRVFDVAHNPQGVGVLKDFVSSAKQGGQVHAVVGIMQDKAIAELLRIMLPLVSVWHVAAPAVTRAAPAETLAALLQQLGAAQIQQYDSIAAAYQQAILQMEPADQCVIFGSFFTVREALIKEYQREA